MKVFAKLVLGLTAVRATFFSPLMNCALSLPFQLLQSTLLQRQCYIQSIVHLLFASNIYPISRLVYVGTEYATDS